MRTIFFNCYPFIDYCYTRFLYIYNYYIKADGIEIAKENTTLNNKGDSFYHSVYIQSKFFDYFDTNDSGMTQLTIGGLSHKKSPEFEFVMSEVNRHLYDMRQPFIKETVSKIVDALDIEGAFPEYNPKNILDQYRKSQISEMVSAIYVAQPKLFTNSMNKEQKKTFIRLLDLRQHRTIHHKNKTASQRKPAVGEVV